MCVTIHERTLHGERGQADEAVTHEPTSAATLKWRSTELTGPIDSERGERWQRQKLARAMLRGTGLPPNSSISDSAFEDDVTLGCVPRSRMFRHRHAAEKVDSLTTPTIIIMLVFVGLLVCIAILILWPTRKARIRPSRIYRAHRARPANPNPNPPQAPQPQQQA